ncbi:Asp-tRNA(Asn)/Glu-tRNA(Gln) amidotransferase subunit GatC [Candidatus Gottesmanbacteria bacterium]|nr:Asp-tRNA(Asn)/Glu-tRNA(Gln) amidotransferase subunit GatC [Candidatus Gottesmanbacteria bacterium]
MAKFHKALTTHEVSHVAHLARLGLSKEDLEKFQKQLSQIIEFVDELENVDTKGIEPTSQVTGLENVFREDEIKPSLSQEVVLSNAPRKHNGYFVVDAIFNQ